MRSSVGANAGSSSILYDLNALFVFTRFCKNIRERIRFFILGYNHDELLLKPILKELLKGDLESLGQVNCWKDYALPIDFMLDKR